MATQPPNTPSIHANQFKQAMARLGLAGATSSITCVEASARLTSAVGTVGEDGVSSGCLTGEVNGDDGGGGDGWAVEGLTGLKRARNCCITEPSFLFSMIWMSGQLSNVVFYWTKKKPKQITIAKNDRCFQRRQLWATLQTSPATAARTLGWKYLLDCSVKKPKYQANTKSVYFQYSKLSLVIISSISLYSISSSRKIDATRCQIIIVSLGI